MITGSLFVMVMAGLVMGLVAGFVMHRADYCVAGMFRDLFLFGRLGMLRFLILQVVVSMLLFELARLSGLLPLYPFPMLAAPSLCNLLAGTLFGLGMVMAGGCVFGTLYKMGAGSVISAVAFFGLILGSGLYALIHPWWSDLYRVTTLVAGHITLPQLLGISPTIFVLLFGGPALLLLFKWQRRGLWQRGTVVAGYLQPWKSAVILALLGLLSYVLIGMPMGATTTFAKAAAMLTEIVAPQAVADAPFFQTVALDLRHPFSNARLWGGPGPQVDTILAMQLPLIAGVVLGSMLSALLLREFNIRFRLPPRQLVGAMAGGLLMGLAARMTPGCNIWHLMGGLPVMAMQSCLFLLGLFPGAWLGGKIIKAMVRLPART